ncbi:MAG: enoyl-CoA hydratase/isomerase family protein [Phenylobacterium sp.]|uniref:enoyl-CoA hydratase/isomerase family protein n=1 Tax=Phenylobacterium sp. TaxID=1871053 RepID=UPI0027332C88|nr:enoyl-CoA hydratase/isomerase family protein [Phenylobacterium sp.]MDP3174144.1 enoyl-CoA hydratase/isomerase family protein [Phenylobacterium sp.]
MTSHISYELRGRVAYITIERPERLNALGLQTMSELADAFLEASDSASAQVIVLTAAGERAFCAGLDLKEADELARAGKSFPQPMRGRDRNLFELILEAPKPTIAAINGDAVGGGCEIALACDLRVAADHARIGMPEAKRGMGANFGSVLLPRLMPRAIALEMLYTGRLITAEEAQQHGLLNRRFPAAEFRAEVSQYAAAIAENAPLTLQRYKHMTLKGWGLPVHAALRLDVGPNPYTSEDRIEGVRAFVEKRTPKWQGR